MQLKPLPSMELPHSEPQGVSTNKSTVGGKTSANELVSSVVGGMMTDLMQSNDPLVRLECTHEIALAELGVAEDFAWWVSILAGLLAGQYTHWLLGLIAFAASFYFSTSRFRDKESKAQDAYFRAANLGQYSRALASRDSES